eukprot:UN20974
MDISCFGSFLPIFIHFSRAGLSSAHQIRTLRSVEVELSLRKRAKDKILFFRAN